MKKLMAILLTLVVLLALSAVAFANGNEYTVRVNGNGNNARIHVYRDGVLVHTSAARPANNAWYQVTLDNGTGTVVAVFISGNRVSSYNTTPAETPDTPTIDGGENVQTPNHSSGGEGVQRIGNVEIRGNGNSARIWINNQDTGVRPANNTYTTVEFSGYTIEVFVRGNAILRWNLVEEDYVPYVPYVPTIVEQHDFYQFVRLNQVESRFVGTNEVSREFVNGAAIVYDWYRNNNFPGVNGQGVRTGAAVTGTLDYQFVRNYVEQFERVYEWVDVTVWSDGTRDEVVRKDSEHVRGDLVDGGAYYTGPYGGSRDISVSGGEIILHMGFQGGLHDRTADVTIGAFTVNFELLNTGNSPSNTVVRITEVNLAAL